MPQQIYDPESFVYLLESPQLPHSNAKEIILDHNFKCGIELNTLLECVSTKKFAGHNIVEREYSEKNSCNM